MRTKSTKQNHGFTIIEVMIVLAIAGLILAIVFLAVPALQRGARNNSRKNDATHLAALVNEYAANHGGLLPSGAQLVTATTGEHFAIMAQPGNGDVIAGNNPLGDTTTMKVNETASCDLTTGVVSVPAGTSTHTFAISFSVEIATGNTPQCIPG